MPIATATLPTPKPEAAPVAKPEVEPKPKAVETPKVEMTTKPVEPTRLVAEASKVEPAAKTPAQPKAEPQPVPKAIEPVKLVDPTTTKAAITVIDLRVLPKLNFDKKFYDESTLTMYLSKSSLVGALAYYNAEMGARGWKEHPGAAPDAKQYAMRTYTKDNYSIGMSLGSSGDNDASITLTNLGNVDMTTLPQPPDSKQLKESSPVAAHYHTDKDISSTADACRKALKSAGWLEYRGYESEDKNAVKRWDSQFIKNSEHVTFLVGELPAGGPAKTYAGYHAAQVLPFDIPVIPDATNLQLDPINRHMNFKTTQDPSRVAEFYRKAYGALGWEDRSKKDNAPSNDKGGLLIFDDRKEMRFFIQVLPGDAKEGGSKVAVRPLSHEEPKLAEDKPSSTPEYDRAVAKGKEEAARKARDAQSRAESKEFSKTMRDQIGKAFGKEAGEIQAKTGIDVSKMIADALKDDPEGTPKAADNTGQEAADKPKAADNTDGRPAETPKVAAAFIAAETMQLPKGATDIAKDPAEKTISYATTEDAKAQEEFFNGKLKPMGWDTVSVSRGTVNDDVHVTLGYSKDSTELEVDIRYKEALRTGTTVISGKGLRFDPAPGGVPVPPPVKVDSLIAEEVQGLPIPKENNGHTAESSPFRKSIEAQAKAPLAPLAAFYRKELTGRGWKEGPVPALSPVDPNKVAMAFTAASGVLDVTLTRKADDTTISLIERNTEAARKAGMLPKDGRARLMIGNGFKADAVVEINGRPYTVKKESGTKDPTSALKLDLFPGKNQLVIKLPGQKDQNEVVDSAAGDSWGLMIVETGGALVIQLY